MNNEQKFRVALIKPPMQGHKFRGTGVYTDRLYRSLKNHRQISVSLIDFSDNLEAFNIIHYPYFDPFFLTLPLFKKKPTVVTVHDLIPLRYPNFFPTGIRGTVKWRFQKLALLTSSAIITDSFASKEEIVRYTGINRERIHVIYLGIGEEFKIIKSKTTLEGIRKKLKLPHDFILHVGDVNYNKNIPGLVKAFNIIRNSYSKLALVLVGKGFVTPSPQLTEILDLIALSKLEDKVYRLGHVALSDLVGLYNLAKVYIQPSFAEGFGLPALEAMACGIPVVVSNVSSLPEIVGDTGLLVNPYNVEEIKSSILTIQSDSKKKEELIKKGLARVKQFSWEKCAKETIKVYQKCTRRT